MKHVRTGGTFMCCSFHPTFHPSPHTTPLIPPLPHPLQANSAYPKYSPGYLSLHKQQRGGGLELKWIPIDLLNCNQEDPEAEPAIRCPTHSHTPQVCTKPRVVLVLQCAVHAASPIVTVCSVEPSVMAVHALLWAACSYGIGLC